MSSKSLSISNNAHIHDCFHKNILVRNWVQIVMDSYNESLFSSICAFLEPLSSSPLLIPVVVALVPVDAAFQQALLAS